MYSLQKIENVCFFLTMAPLHACMVYTRGGWPLHTSRVIITFLSCDSGRLLKVIANCCTIRRPFLGLLWSAPSWQSSNALCKWTRQPRTSMHSSLARPTFAARVGTVYTGRLLTLVSAIPQLNLEGLGHLY